MEPPELDAWIRPGDRVMVSPGCSEPRALVRALIAQRERLRPAGVFVGSVFSREWSALRPGDLPLVSFGAFAGGRALARAGLLDIVPCHYSQLPRLIADGPFACDVALVQLAPDGRGGMGFAGSHAYAAASMRRARTVVAQLNATAPWTGPLDADLRVDAVLAIDEPPAVQPSSPPGELDRRIAAHAARVVEDGDTVEIGLGGLGDAVWDALADRRDLGVHCGTVSDRLADMTERGVVTNARKPVDAGRSLANDLYGGERLMRWAAGNPALSLRPIEQTHDPRRIAALDRFVAINSAVEVDLLGQIGAESSGGQPLGGIGGHGDFMRGALLAEHGRSVVMLPSASPDGARSRIVASMSGPVTTPRGDADAIATEWGVAELRGRTDAQRARAMIGIAHPAHREALERVARAAGWLAG